MQDQGKFNTNSGKMEEKFNKSATDASSSIGASGLEVSIDLTVQKYQASLKSAQASTMKLHKHIGQAEMNQVHVKKNAPDQLEKYKQGLQVCRDFHMACLEQLEELKGKTKASDGEAGLQGATKALEVVLAQIADHCKAMSVAAAQGASPLCHTPGSW